MTTALPFQFVPDPATWAPPSGLVVRVSSRIRDKRALMGTFRQRFALPDWFGENWDALDECLHDLSWLDAKQVILMHDGVPFTAQSTKLRRIYLELLTGLAEDNAGPGPRWTIVFPESSRSEIAQTLDSSSSG